MKLLRTALIPGLILAVVAVCLYQGTARAETSDADFDALFDESAPPPPADKPASDSGQAAAEGGEDVTESGASTVAKAAPRKAALEEIIVTAQKREENIQDTPISIKAFDAEALEVHGIEGLGDLGTKVPGMTVEPFPINNSTLRIFIRGMGIFDVQLTQDSPIGIYADGVYIARSTGTALDMAELERIEILKGPQGTLYGRNVTGGAVNLITKRPVLDEFGFRQKFTYGERNLFTSKSTINVPLIQDELGLKFALMSKKEDGYVENTGPGGDFGDKEILGYRADLRWQPSDWDWLTVDYTFDRSDFSSHNYMYQAVLPPKLSKGVTDPVKNNGAEATVFSNRRLDSLATGMPYEESSTFIQGHALTAMFDFDTYQIKYIGAYRELDDSSYADLGGGKGSTDFRIDTHRYDGPSADAANGGPTPLVLPNIQQEQTSHEFQLSQEGLFDGQFRYIVGAYFFEEYATEDNSPLHHQFSGVIDSEIAAVFGLPEVLLSIPGDLLFPIVNPKVVNFVSQFYEIENTAEALFGQFTYSPNLFDQKAHFTVGVRQSKDERYARKDQTDLFYVEGSVNGQGQAFDLGSPIFNNPVTAAALEQADFVIPQNREFDNVVAKQSFENTSVSAIFEYDWTDSINTYIKRVEAYRSGGFNTRDPHRDGNQGPANDGVDYGFGFVEGFDEEEITSYELGLKSELMDRRMRLNVGLFRTEYENLQVPLLIAGTVADTKTTNLGFGLVEGLETELMFALTGDIFFLLNHNYMKSSIDIGGNPALRANIVDNPDFPSSPKHSGTFGVDWTLRRFDFGELNLNFDYNYVGERRGLPFKGRDGLTSLPAFGLWNARLSLLNIPVGERSMASVALWGRNLLDEEYMVHAIDNAPQSDRSVLWGEPRKIGIDLSYEF